jgi:hypothetical protein
MGNKSRVVGSNSSVLLEQEEDGIKIKRVEVGTVKPPFYRWDSVFSIDDNIKKHSFEKIMDDLRERDPDNFNAINDKVKNDVL